ncbi:MAG: protein-disulfide reductase DsbD [Rhodocyclaceae bacterium]|nr:protein-disulfide reductase DsbD [Rhodocyclaceae bacterium]
MLIRLVFFLALIVSGAVRAADPLPPEQVFRFNARVIDAATIEATWQVRRDYYLYRDKFKFSSPDASLATPVLPKGEMKDDEAFGRVEVYRDELAVRVPVSAVTSANGEIRLQAQSQGCWDGGICYPPQKHNITLNMTGAPPAGAANAASAAPSAEDSSGITALLSRAGHDGGYMLLLASFFGFGLLLAFTPCMFPMIPILSGIIVQHGHAVTHARAFVLSLAYVLGMALTYALIGVAAGLSGTLLSTALQNVWVLGAFALVFVVLSLSMFGLYELQLPSALQSRISASANRQGGSLPAIAVMGALSALIVGPCVAAPLAGALLYIAKTGDGVLGGAALFVMALGMGAPLLLVGAFSRQLLPKSGPWMTAVNRLFGVLMLSTALWLVSPVLPVWLNMLGWAALLIVPAIFLHALDPLPPHAPGYQKLGKGVGVVMLLAGAAMLAGVLGGARDPLQPLGFVRANAGIAVSPAPTWGKVSSVAELDAAIAASAARNTPVMLDFYADWCVSCKEMERNTLSDATVAASMQRFTLLKADVTLNTADDKALLARFDLFGPPGIIFFDVSGKELPAPRVIGYVPPERFSATLDTVLKGS